MVIALNAVGFGTARIFSDACGTLVAAAAAAMLVVYFIVGNCLSSLI